MVLGIPKEVKPAEYRVAILPVGVEALVQARHKVIIQESAGAGSGISNDEYVEAGAEIFHSPEEVYRSADMIVKVKEPVPIKEKLKQAMEKVVSDATKEATITRETQETMQEYAAEWERQGGPPKEVERRLHCLNLMRDGR